MLTWVVVGLSRRCQQQMQAPSPQGVASVGRRCYIMNLAWETTWQTLKDHFRQVSLDVFSLHGVRCCCCDWAVTLEAEPASETDATSLFSRPGVYR